MTNFTQVSNPSMVGWKVQTGNRVGQIVSEVWVQGAFGGRNVTTISGFIVLFDGGDCETLQPHQINKIILNNPTP